VFLLVFKAKVNQKTCQSTHSKHLWSKKQTWNNSLLIVLGEMFNKINRLPKYWLFQVMGWALFTGINIFFALTYNLFDRQFILRISIYVVIGFLMSHVMRKVIKAVRLLERHVNVQLVGFVLVSFGFAVLVGTLETYASILLNLEYKEEAKFEMLQKIVSNMFTSFIYFFIWNCIYFIYHYVAETRKNQLDNLKLEALVKSLELKTIKSHINPHFIFNALNSIRALIDEDPNRARHAVTGLSKILRSSMQSDQQEIITLGKELDIVKDYLALELIRFEDRLKVSYQIDEETLVNPIPPMMLQTLVENAIKHGIGKSIAGGEILIKANALKDKYELRVVNTGRLDQQPLHEGFGLTSTSNRLNLIFGEKAVFSIFQSDENHVEAKAIIPLK
jgi:LytS/YehU family sensor histidine kinase